MVSICTIHRIFWLFFGSSLCIYPIYGDEENAEYAIADPATLWDILKDGTQEVIKQNHDELKNWQPYGDVDDV